MKQMFEKTEKLILEQSDEIYGVNTINWDDSSWKHLSLFGDEEVISLSHAKVYVFSDSVLCFGKINENPQSNTVWEDRIHHIAALQQSPRDPFKNERKARRKFRTDISWRSQDNDQECELSANLVPFHARRFSPGRWSFLGLGSKNKWYSTHDSKPQGEWDRVAELMMIKFGESKHPVFRSTSPLPRGVLKSKGGRKLSIHFCADEGTIETVFRTIISVNQLSIYGAVSD